MHNILALNHVCKNFDTFSLKDVSFALPSGFVMGFIGQNGAGKTTTIKSILNMLHLDGGDIQVFGKDHKKYEREIKENIGVVMDQPFYVGEWNLFDVQNAISPFYEKWDKQKYGALMKSFDLDPKKKVKDLSRGMKMKLMIATALSHEAKLLILDEPTSGLDAVVRNELMDILRGFMSDEEKGILFSTHITSDLEKIADYITFIDNGQIRYADTKDTLLEKYRIVKGSSGQLTEENRKYILGCREHGVGFEGLIDKDDLGRLPSTVVTEQSNLDEIVLHLTKGGNSHE